MKTAMLVKGATDNKADSAFGAVTQNVQSCGCVHQRSVAHISNMK